MGSTIAGAELNSSAMMAGVVGIYLLVESQNIRIQKGIWNKISYTDFIPRLLQRGRNMGRPQALLHQDKIRLFAPKTNIHVGATFPVIGTLKQETTISGQQWFVYELDKIISVAGHSVNHVAVRPKNRGEELTMEKIQISVLFPKITLDLYKPEVQTTDFMYVGTLFSRPI